MHDLILRNRVEAYEEGGLMRHLHGRESPLPAGARRGFEHHLPSAGILVAFPAESWPFLHAAMEARSRGTGAWSGRLTPRERQLADHILAEIKARGPLSSEMIDDDRVARKVWGKSSLAKATLQKLFFHGRVLIAARRGIRRLYDLPERVLPASLLGRVRPDVAEIERWLTLSRFRQHRLFTLKRREIPLVEDLVQQVRVDGCPPLHCLREDLPLLDQPAAAPAGPGQRPLLLAPLDPLIYHRRITSALWNFDYIWEAYTPSHRRARGYYALPVLAGTEIVGHLDPKADRQAQTLKVVSRRVRRGHSISHAVQSLAAFLRLRR